MKTYSLNAKVWFCIGLLAFAYVANTALSTRTAVATIGGLNHLMGKVIKSDQVAGDIRDAQRRITLYLMETISRPDEANKQKFFKLYESSREEIKTLVAQYRTVADDAGIAFMDKYQKELESYLAISAEAAALGLAGHTQAGFEKMATGDKFRNNMRDFILEMNKTSAARLTGTYAELEGRTRGSMTMNLIIAALSILATTVLTFFILRAVNRAIAGVVGSLSDGSSQVSQAASQIAASSETLSQSTTENAASLEETAASVEEMNSMIGKNVENARAAERTSGLSQDAVVKGQAIITRMLAAMETIRTSSQGLTETVKIIEQIEKKTKVINDIVNKTELLSFNASVEAARAGEHGRGFAVVAEEVGNLARLSGAAAEEIGALLEASIQKVHGMVGTTNRSVEGGTSVAEECRVVFAEVVQNVNQVSGMASEISSASEEQSRGISEITKAMNQLDQMTQQNASTSQESASAAEQLSAQSAMLKAAVSQLITTVHGGRAGETYVEAAPAPKATKKRYAAGSNVVPMRRGGSSRLTAAVRRAPARASADAVPAYDSEGFTDI